MRPIDRYKLPLVKDFMTIKVMTVTPGLGLEEVVKLFNENRIASAPVIESEGSKDVIGFITEDDCLRELAGGSFFQTPETPTVASAMSRNVFTLRPDMDVFGAEIFFRENGLRQAPVVDQNQRLLGIVARRDLMLALQKIMEQIGLLTHPRLTPPNFSMMTEAEWKVSSR